MLSATVRYHMSHYKEVYLGTDLIQTFLRDSYVGDSTTSFHGLDTATEFYNKIKRYMIDVGFSLRKWDSNVEELRCIMEQDDKTNDVTIAPPNEEKFSISRFGERVKYRKVLGINWEVKSDQFIYEFNTNTVSQSNILEKT